jgi:hypothetical protein
MEPGPRTPVRVCGTEPCRTRTVVGESHRRSAAGYARTTLDRTPANSLRCGAVVDVIGMAFGARPFRVHIDPAHHAEIVNGVADRVREELLRRIGLEDVLHPH